MFWNIFLGLLWAVILIAFGSFCYACYLVIDLYSGKNKN